MKKSALILLIAVAISTVSCVDNAVSPQVEAIRTQQVEWMKAKANIEIALADMAKADSELQIAKNKTLLQSELNTLALAVANSGDNLAKEYYLNYNAEANTLSNLYANRVTTQINIANNQLVLNSPNVLKDFLAITQASIDADNIKLTAQNATLAIFTNAIDANSTTSLTTERFTIASEIQVVSAKNINLLSDKNKLDIQRNPLLDEKVVLETERGTYSSPADDAKIAAVNIKIDALIAKIAPLTTSINTLNASIAANNVIINTNTLLINNLNSAITSLSLNNVSINFVTLANTVVSTKATIAGLKASILLNQALLLVNSTTLAIKAAEANIVVFTKDLETVNIKITAQEKIVAYWKGLLDKIFTA